ncbi:MAG: HIT domain-containing protein [Rubricoccaceae bacterium]|nr:HIT domain-containing protein [Rubricoccaceae bacterium]
MDRLWSPWRSAHVARAAEDARTEGGRGGPDVFARIAAAAPEDDADHLVVYRGATVFVVMNRYPYTTGHLLVLPYREVGDYEALTDAERAEMAAVTARALGWLRTALRPDGFNVGMNLGSAAGAGIPRHLHQHLVPRWHGDTNFMPALAATRVMPESLEATYRKLRAAVGADAATGGG